MKKNIMITAPFSVKDEQFLGSTAMQNQIQQLGFKKTIVNINFNQSFFFLWEFETEINHANHEETHRDIKSQKEHRNGFI